MRSDRPPTRDIPGAPRRYIPLPAPKTESPPGKRTQQIKGQVESWLVAGVFPCRRDISAQIAPYKHPIISIATYLFLLHCFVNCKLLPSGKKAIFSFPSSSYCLLKFT